MSLQVHNQQIISCLRRLSGIYFLILKFGLVVDCQGTYVHSVALTFYKFKVTISPTNMYKDVQYIVLYTFCSVSKHGRQPIDSTKL